ncbi:enoyl-CoA hydratase/isomerase family protein [Labedaea rhizosphaerae]|uniref:enoyl-CoA hydratase n=1 Tax=Labedaea rhizosphaerae TaxID=598644 RepID=A0A4R6S003_LABRH|nr:enoyl-CoA hydratase-related protein [Labedaea rhizosphaerae]TDP91896.1 enoyl-CoA hydratase [Labedaea rhizosphaerae]
MTEPAVRWEDASAGVMVVTMAHGRANALGPPILDGLSAALDEADQRDDVRTIVIASAIPGFFAAGADIKHMSAIDGASFAAYGDRLRGVLDRIAAPPRITIAAVDGLALGGGLELAMAASMRVAGTDAKFGLPEVKLGLIPGAGGTQRLPRLVGRGRAIDIMATARQVRAGEARSIGLVDRVVEAGQALAGAVELGKELRAFSRPALSAVLRTVDAAFDLPLDEGLRYEAAQVQELFEHGEAKEGLTAFLERRSPNFD